MTASWIGDGEAGYLVWKKKEQPRTFTQQSVFFWCSVCLSPWQRKPVFFSDTAWNYSRHFWQCMYLLLFETKIISGFVKQENLWKIYQLQWCSSLFALFWRKMRRLVCDYFCPIQPCTQRTKTFKTFHSFFCSVLSSIRFHVTLSNYNWCKWWKLGYLWMTRSISGTPVRSSKVERQVDKAGTPSCVMAAIETENDERFISKEISAFYAQHRPTHSNEFYKFIVEHLREKVSCMMNARRAASHSAQSPVIPNLSPQTYGNCRQNNN